MVRAADTLKVAILSLALAATVAGGAHAQVNAPSAPPSSRPADDRTAAPRHADDRSTSPKADPPKSEPARQAGPQRQPEPQRQSDSPRQADSKHQSPARDDSGRSSLGPAWRPLDPAFRPIGPAWQSDSRSSINGPSVTPRPGDDRFRATPDTFSPDGRRDSGRDRDRRDRERRTNSNIYLGYPYVVPYGFAPYFPSAIPGAAVTQPASPVEPARDEPVGYLRLRVEPRTAEVYVDGAYAGTVDEFGGTAQRLLPAGIHRVELVAPGFETFTVDVRIPDNDTITFARDLDRATDRPAAPAAPAVPHKAMYIVPRCYVGDTPPRASDLPAGCSLDDLRVIP
jgi:hypothetical protein